MINKEFRALLPAWVACALAILVSRWGDLFSDLGLLAYFIGSAGLGAWVMGHEYAHGTVASLLSLPVPRRRIWTVKLAVTASMLVALAALAQLFLRLDPEDLKLGLTVIVLPSMVALFVTPWLTMLTRSPLAAAIFTFAVLGGSLAAGEWIGDVVTFMWWALGGLSAIGAVLGWRTFATLQVDEGHAADIQLPMALRRTVGTVAVAGRRPLLRLMVKELRVQQLAIVVALLWMLAYSISELSGVRQMTASAGATNSGLALAFLQAFYSLVLPAVIGSLACAEERQLGTLDSQLLLPVRSSTQWIVKAATALALAVLLAAVLPLVLAGAFGDHLLITGARNENIAAALTIVLVVTSISLYVSTVARSGLRSLMGAIAATVMFGFVVARMLIWGPGRQVFPMVQALRSAHTHYRYGPVIMIAIPSFIHTLAALTLALLIVALALPNFRYVARRPTIIVAHAALVIACVIAYDVVLGVVMALNS